MFIFRVSWIFLSYNKITFQLKNDSNWIANWNLSNDLVLCTDSTRMYRILYMTWTTKMAWREWNTIGNENENSNIWKMIGKNKNEQDIFLSPYYKRGINIDLYDYAQSKYCLFCYCCDEWIKTQEESKKRAIVTKM